VFASRRCAGAQGRLALLLQSPHGASGERVLELGAGLGLAAVLAAGPVPRVVAPTSCPRAVETIRANAALNGVTIDRQARRLLRAGGR
jgi:predicted nicotinamide N-methyase